MAKSKKPKHIAIAGNIGSGKTTLTEMLSKHYRWIPQFEDVDHNPYLNDFYEDMPRWSFNLQIYFLNSRLNQLLEIHRGTETVIQDRTIYEDANIFAPNLHEMGLMSKRDFDNYFNFFQTLKNLVQPPESTARYSTWNRNSDTRQNDLRGCKYFCSQPARNGINEQKGF